MKPLLGQLTHHSPLTKVGRDGVEPPQPAGGWVTATWALQCPAGAVRMSNDEIRFPRRTALPSRLFSKKGVVAVALQASPMGFEPTTSGVTGRRALPCSTRTCQLSVVSCQARPVVPDGIEPSFPGCEPDVFAAGPRDEMRWQESNLRRDGSEPPARASTGPTAMISQDGWIRTSDLVRPKHADSQTFPRPEFNRKSIGTEHPMFDRCLLPASRLLPSASSLSSLPLAVIHLPSPPGAPGGTRTHVTALRERSPRR